MPLLDEVRRFLKAQNLTENRICAAFSGGADSLSLLHALHTLREECTIDLSAIHIQHNLRGEESRRDEQFCQSFCEAHGIPLTIVSCDVQGYAQQHGVSAETAARECRYAAFAEHCADYVATAHTASDNLETVLLHMTRGTGLKGLCGIPPQRGQFIRPLLRVTRAQVEEYLAEQGLSYMTDSTNHEDAFRRNFLRHHAVPALQECNPSIAETCAEMTEILRTEEDFLSLQTNAAYENALRSDGSLKDLDTLHPAIQRRCIARLLGKYGLAGRRNILAVQMLLQQGGSVELQRGGVCAHVSRGVLYLEQPQPQNLRKPLQLGENCIFEGILAEAEVISRAEPEKFARIHTLFANSVLDYDIINGSAELHSRIPALYLRQRGRSISIKKWLNEKVPPARRSTVHYLSDAEGLLWAEGLGADERAAVTDSTQNMLLLRIITQSTQMAHSNTMQLW